MFSKFKASWEATILTILLLLSVEIFATSTLPVLLDILFGDYTLNQLFSTPRKLIRKNIL
jgi:hypothetical protein